MQVLSTQDIALVCARSLCAKMSRECQIVGHQDGLAPEIVFGQNRTVKAHLFDDYSHFVYGIISFCPGFFSCNVRLRTVANDRHRTFAFAHSRIPAGVYVWNSKDRMVCDRIPRGKTAIIHWARTADCTRGLPVTGDSRVVDHAKRIDSRVLYRSRLLPRFAAASLALGMIGALYTSVRLGEDWLRAALYFIILLSLTLTGAGKFSIDRLLNKE